MLCAYLLIVHGSRDPLYASSLMALVQSCAVQLPPDTLLEVAYLELAAIDLPSQIRQFAKRSMAAHCQELKILPLFLAPGVHSSNDIPLAIAEVRQDLSSALQLTLLEPIGHSMVEILPESRRHLPATSILLAHGTRYPSPFLLDLATAIDTELVSWAIPTVGAQLFTDWVAKNGPTFNGSVGILLYFLFPGKITATIAVSINELRLLFPAVDWQVTEPLAMGSSFATKIVQRLQA